MYLCMYICMLYKFPGKYYASQFSKNTTQSRWVGRVKPHCSCVLINNYNEREKGIEGGGITGIHMYVCAHTIHTYIHVQALLPIIMHARAHVMIMQTAYVCIACHDLAH